MPSESPCLNQTPQFHSKNYFKKCKSPPTPAHVTSPSFLSFNALKDVLVLMRNFGRVDGDANEIPRCIHYCTLIFGLDFLQ